jgi:hypothetical protein
MNDRPDSYEPSEPLDDLVEELLNCGGVLSQMIGHMVHFENSGRATPGVAAIPDVAHSLIKSVLDGVPKRYSKRDIKVSAAIVGEVTEAICHDIFLISPEMLEHGIESDGPTLDGW